MKKVFIGLLLAILLTACGSSVEENPAIGTQIVAAGSTNEAAEDASPIGGSIGKEESTPEATQGPNCLGAELNEIGQSIADRFDATNYEEVMIWFCNGAEFEDILLALQSEEQGDAGAEEMLVMLADGFSWDEIWQLVGITE